MTVFGSDMTRRPRIIVAGIALTLAGWGVTDGSGVTKHGRPVSPHAGWVMAGLPLPPRAVEVMGVSGTLQLRVDDPGRPGAPPVFVTLGRALPREPGDVCFGAYPGNESPEDGDVFCQIRGSQPFVLSLGDYAIPYTAPESRFVTVWGQATRNVTRVELIGPSRADTPLPLTSHRLFGVTLSSSARGMFRIRAWLTSGSSFTHGFRLPLTRPEAGAWPRLRRPGAVFSTSPIGENILTKSYRQLLKRLGPPLQRLARPGGVRCIYYDIVGYADGWVFCFKGQRMVGVAANQTRPRVGPATTSAGGSGPETVASAAGIALQVPAG